MRSASATAFGTAVLSLALLAPGGLRADAGEATATGPDLEPALARVAETAKRREALVSARASATGRKRLLIEEQLWQLRVEAQEGLSALAKLLVAEQEAGSDIAEERGRLEALIRANWSDFEAELLAREAEMGELLAEEAVPEADSAAERRLRDERRRLAAGYRLLVDTLATLAPLELALDDVQAFAREHIEGWAEGLLAETHLAGWYRDGAAARAAASPEDAERQSALLLAEERLDDATRQLSDAVELMKRLEIATTRYDQALIETTGEITSDVLDVDVTLGLLRRWRERAFENVATGAPNWMFKTLVFLLILAAFRAAASLTRHFVQQSVRASRLNLSQLLQDTLVSWSARTVMMVGLLVAISQLGVEIGALLAGLGIAGFVLGFALQDSLSNFAAGAMILLYRPFDVGDLVEAAGVSGVVSRMTLVSTTILTVDNQTLIVPNTKIWGDVIRNVTSQEIRRVDLVFGIGYDADIDQADAVLRDILAGNEKVLDEPEPTVEVYNLGDSSVDFVVRPWAKSEDYWPVLWSITREVKQRFDREGITIPFPQRDVHHYVERSESPA